jgi:hypothetical protein
MPDWLKWVMLGVTALAVAAIFGSSAGSSQTAARGSVKTQTQRATNTYPNPGNDGPP